ncbi:MAG: hypothetical protein COA79_08290 [Planctomycetota bacterium]|nr:MAG: hypothetical protein COA79_08290 [Planctomycetota bacterium]
MKRKLIGWVSFFLATIIWSLLFHLFFSSSDILQKEGISSHANALAKRHLKLWVVPKLRKLELESMRSTNAEWDFMGRSFLVWALANMALRDSSQKKEYLYVMDQIIDETLKLEKENTPYHFLMDYARFKPWVINPSRSIFIDGEISLMLAVRCFIKKRSDYLVELDNRVEIMVQQMKKSPVLSSESYPDECWTFCNSIALASIKIHDVLSGDDHSVFLKQWFSVAREKLIDQKTGLLISSYTQKGVHLDGPEGSSIWLVSHALSLIDPVFAKEQYELAKKYLGKSFVGFGWASEWPPSWQGPLDVDSGVVIPVLDIGTGSSGLAFIGAATFEDFDYYKKLRATLSFGGFPVDVDDSRYYAAGNQVGDAVLLYSEVLGPLWKKIRENNQ